MWAFTRLSLAAVVLAPALSAHAAQIVIEVGPGEQKIFTPSNITASVGDVVSFHFLTGNHSVTQSSFATPCEPLAGGVDSGFQAVAADTTSIPEFSFAINNASAPLFFFSKQTIPVNECNKGMVFSINQNPNSAKSFAAFQANAKADVPAATATAGVSSSTVTAVPAAASSGAKILVQVGAGGGLTFSPSNISANIGDNVAFQFINKNHSVTQSSFASPCEALVGGIDSGFQFVAANATAVPEFGFTITNASKPLFFFSKQTIPVNECNKGMVFSINQDPNSANSFTAFQANAKADVPAATATAGVSSSTVAAVPAATSSGAKILVQVGAGGGLTFSPSNISANIGDNVAFQFINRNHSITQSSFASPCEALASGIDSGFQFVAANATAVPEFSFTITNASIPLFFFSKQTVPVNECNKGMVFSINQNPNSAKSFAAFQAHAKADIQPAAKANTKGRRVHARDFAKVAGK